MKKSTDGKKKTPARPAAKPAKTEVTRLLNYFSQYVPQLLLK